MDSPATPTMSTEGRSRKESLERLISPLTLQAFISEYWHQKFAHLPGSPERFEGLFSWEALNGVVTHHRLSEPRVRLVKGGARLAAEEYLVQVPANLQPGKCSTRIDLPNLYKQLRDGATLVIDSVDEIHPALSSVIEDVEHTLKSDVRVDVLASWASAGGFQVHWDDFDVLALQIDGRKEWSIFGPTRIFPLIPDVESNTVPPPKAIWNGVLEPGDALYIPRGWWHGVSPVGEATLHLTLGFKRIVSVDLVHWIADKLRHSDIGRRDLPRFGTRIEREQFARELKDALDPLWSDSVLDQYFAALDAAARPRLSGCLPVAALLNAFASVGDDATIEWHALGHEGERPSQDGTLELTSDDDTWVFEHSGADVVKYLSEVRTCRLGSVYSKFRDQLSQHELDEFLSDLLHGGLITVS